MKTLPAGLQAHLDGGATTLCWCWTITRRDGTVFGFTDHDEPVTVAGTVCDPATGMTASDVVSGLGLSVDGLEVEGALSSDALSAADLRAGLFDDAAVTLYRVNWQDPSQTVLMRSGNLGEIAQRGAAFTAEIRGLTHRLQQPRGRVFQASCDAEFGDARCGVSLAGAPNRVAASVIEDRGEGILIVSNVDGQADGWFARGRIVFTSGALAGTEARIRTHGGSRIALWSALPGVAAPGDALNVIAGCDKRFATCRDRFDNHINFRGFPHMPGNSIALGYPRRGDPDNDGGALTLGGT